MRHLSVVISRYLWKEPWTLPFDVDVAPRYANSVWARAKGIQSVGSTNFVVRAFKHIELLFDSVDSPRVHRHFIIGYELYVPVNFEMWQNLRQNDFCGCCLKKLMKPKYRSFFRSRK